MFWFVFYLILRDFFPLWENVSKWDEILDGWEKSNVESRRGKGSHSSLSKLILKKTINFKEDSNACVFLKGTHRYEQPSLKTTIIYYN